MTKKIIPTQTHLFVKYIADLPLRHQRELMERPFVSLNKKPRFTPIEYRSDDGKVFVRVTGGDKGMATIWDLDFIIAWTSMIVHQRDQRVNDISATLKFYPQDILETIRRETGGREYQLMRDALYRLATTRIETNVRHKDTQDYDNFTWIDRIKDQTSRNATYSHGMTVKLSDWLYEGIFMDGGVLKMSADYFNLTGAYERWLYQLAARQAGGAGAMGTTIPFSTLYRKSGSETKPRAFKHALMKIIRENELPDFHLHVPDSSARDPLLHITLREHRAVAFDASRPMLPDLEPGAEEVAPTLPASNDTGHPPEIPAAVIAQLKKDVPHYLPAFLKAKFDDDCRRRAALPLNYGKDFLEFARAYAKAQPAPAAPATHLALPVSPDMLTLMRAEFPKWDIGQLYERFDSWIKNKKRPKNIDQAFYTFAKTHISKNPL